MPSCALDRGGTPVARLPLTLACWDYDRTRPLIDGRIQPRGIDLDITVSPPKALFARMLQRPDL
jgi:4,5-dihydroxyphthalate decarboxylase